MGITQLKTNDLRQPVPGNFTNAATGSGTGYKYVSFTANGTLVVDVSGLFTVLLVGGGGASRGWGGGGGGAVTETKLVIPAGSYPVTVGAGGTGSDPQGKPSSIAGIISIGGGGVSFAETFGGATYGGGSYYSGGTSYCSGGDCNPSNYTNSGGGGGGAATAGTAGNSGAGGNGGDGVLSTITGASVYYGGGGAACRTTSGTAHSGNGSAGLGGTAAHTAGAANTGAGAGGQYGTTLAGGSGIVIVRVNY